MQGCVESVVEPKQSYEGNATRTVMTDRFDLVPYEGVKAAARRSALGAGIHGERNWESGGPEFAKACVNHMLNHAMLFSQFQRQEDNDAVVWNSMAIAYFKSKGLLKEKE